MSQTSVIPFPSNTNSLPDYLRRSSVNPDVFAAGVSSGFPHLSIKGKVWTVVRDGERKVVSNPKDPDSPATGISVVLLNANPNLSKVYYKNGYDDGAAEKPTCFSNDGIKPSPEGSEIQAKTCAACPHNVWGSGNGGKGKACADSRRIAVARPDALDDPMLLRVPAASLKTLREHAEIVKRHGVPMHSVVTKITFDPEQATPRLIFKPEGMLDEASFNEADRIAADDTVAQILGTAPSSVDEAPVPPKANIDESKVREAASQSSPQPTPAPAPEPKPEPTPEPEPTPAPQPTPEPEPAKQEASTEEQPKAEAKADNGDDFLNELDDLLSSTFDD